MMRPIHRTACSHLVIFLVVMAWFSPWWMAGRFLAPLDLQNLMMSPWNADSSGRYAKNHFVADAVDQYLVYRLIAERDLRREGRVGWSSLTYGGTPQYANTMALYDDWTMQLHRWFDFKTAWHLGLLGQVLAAAIGMYWWLAGRGVTNVWAVCGGLLWAANSQFVTWVYHRWALGSFCWVPWVLWAMDAARRGNRIASALVPVFLALAFLGGTLQHSALVALVVGLAWMANHLNFGKFLSHVMRYFRRSPDNEPDSIRTQEGENSTDTGTAGFPGGSFTQHLVWGILGVGLAGFMFVPCIAAFLESNRLGLHIGSHGYAPGWYPQGPLQPIFNALAYPLHVFPSVLGRCDSLDVLKLFRSDLFYVAFFGSLPMVVAAFAFLKRGTPRVARLLMIAGLLLPLTPLVRLLYQRLFLLFILGGILAFAHFMSASSREEKAKLAKLVAKVAAGGLALWTMASLVLRHPKISELLRNRIEMAMGQGGSFGYYQEWTTQRVSRFLEDLLVWSPHHLLPLGLVAAAVAGLWLASSPSSIRRKFGVLVLAASALLDVTIFASRWVVWSNLPLFAETRETRALISLVGKEGRTTTVIHPTAHMALTPFIPNIPAVYGIASIHGYDSIIPDGMLRPFESPDDASKLGRLGVTHLITWAGNPEVPEPWVKVWSSAGMDLHENPLAVPKYAGFKDRGAFEAFVSGANFGGEKLRDLLGLENRRLIPIPPDLTILRIAENAAPGWRYRFNDGEWKSPAMGADRCMEIHLGSGTAGGLLELEYDPPLRRMGWVVTGISALLLPLLVFWRRPRAATFPA